MRYLLNERGIIDVYIEHVCDEPNTLELLKGGTVPHEAVDEGIMHFSRSDEDIREGCVTQNSQPTPTCNEALETTEGDVDKTYAVHGGDASQQQDPEHNDHDDEDFLDNVHSDVDDEEVLECIRNKKKHKTRIDSHGDLGFDSSFENNEDEFEVSSEDSGDYTIMDEDELEEEKGDVKTTRNGDLWFNPSWADVWFEVGMKVEHVAQFKKAIVKYQIQKGCRLKPVKSDPTRQRIYYVDRLYNWQIFASFDKNDQIFKVKTYYRQHTCFRSLKSNMVGSRVLVEHHRNRIFANLQIRISELVRFSHLELGVHVSRDKCKLAKNKIMKEVKETHVNEFT
ncbi:hypothetical protein SLEP1_g22377 [Rubroshorea leprosula]|uniref:Transposase MuDR plant domain-containing protein n=1 Tax=Rubroshorea leprosula TaxID=152421 RepID=A0AAV5JIC2_9ROSI|nr:hypothetical protein SLEP1_g22377 [Rubroshorea leprosula]